MATTIVLGAGMVGTAAALALQQRGHAVVLVDRRAPGEETSFGNAGLIQTEAAEPYAMPRRLAHLARIALKRSDDVNWHARSLPRLAGPLWAYFRASAPARHRASSAVFAALIARAADDHAPLVEAAGAAPLVRRTGYLHLFRSDAAFAAAAAEAARLTTRYAIPAAALAPDEVARRVPQMVRRLAGAIHWPGVWSCSDPGGLVTAYANLFRRRGGRIVRGDAATLAPHGAGWRCRSAEGELEAQHAVVALGPWSGALVARFGYRVPLVPKRGYHRHFACAAAPPLPLFDAERATMLSPMAAGLRVATGAELAALDAPRSPRQILAAERFARELLELGEAVEATPWSGTRPCIPDMLPVLGPAPRHPGLWFDFGHGHQGFTLGPTTGRMLAALLDGDPADPTAAPLGYRW